MPVGDICCVWAETLGLTLRLALRAMITTALLITSIILCTMATAGNPNRLSQCHPFLSFSCLTPPHYCSSKLCERVCARFQWVRVGNCVQIRFRPQSMLNTKLFYVVASCNFSVHYREITSRNTGCSFPVNEDTLYICKYLSWGDFCHFFCIFSMLLSNQNVYIFEPFFCGWLNCSVVNVVLSLFSQSIQKNATLSMTTGIQDVLIHSVEIMVQHIISLMFQ